MSSDELATIKEALHRIEQAIVGDEKMGQRGIVQRLTDLERKIEAHDKFRRINGVSEIVTGAVFGLTHLREVMLK